MGNNPPSLTIHGGLLARNVVLNFIGLAVPLLIGVAAIPYTIRWLGTDRFGILSLAWVVVGYFSFLDLGLGRATTKYVAEALGRDELKQIPGFFWTSVIFQLILGILGAILLWRLTPVLVGHVLKIPPAMRDETLTTFVLLACSIPVVLVSASFRGILEAGQRFDLVNVVKIPSSVLTYLLPVAGIAAGLRLPGIIALLVLSRGLTLAVWAWLTLRVFPMIRTWPRFDRLAIKPLLSFGGWVTVSNVVGPILVYIDRFMIGTLATIEAVGLYSAPYEFVMRLGIIPGSLVMTLFPTFSTLGGGGDQRKAEILFGRSVKYLLIVMGSLVVILVLSGRFFIGAWLGEKFLQNSLRVFQILSIGFLANTLANVPFGYLQGIGRADVTAKLHLFELFFYVPLTWILIKSWGITGAALSWSFRSFIDMALLFWASVRLGKMPLSVLLGDRVVKAALLLGALAISAGVLMRTAWWGMSLIALTAGFYLTVWRWAFDEGERTWVKATFGNILSGRRARA